MERSLEVISIPLHSPEFFNGLRVRYRIYFSVLSGTFAARHQTFTHSEISVY